MKLPKLTLLLGSTLALGLACSAGGGTPDVGTPDGGSKADAGTAPGGPELLGKLDCDPLVPTQCGYPFPSDVYLVADPKNPGKRHVEFGANVLPKVFRSRRCDRTVYESRDGWSPGQAPLTHLPGATLAGLATQDTLGDSVKDGSPTVLLDTSTGALVPHWAELDMNTSDDDDRAFLLRPAVRLKDATRYVVAIRQVKDRDGKELEPSPVFKALRDGTPNDNVSVGPRRALYAEIFSLLDKAGVKKEGLQLAWDYTTASRENTTGALVEMRDLALAALPADGPDYAIKTVTENPNEFIARRIEGTFHAPLYLDQAGPGAHFNRDEAGHLKQNGWADFDFLVQIPKSVAGDTAGAAVLQQGHGLLGDRGEGSGGYFARLAHEKKYVTVAINLIGMAEDDETMIKKLVTGDIGQFQSSVERQHQGLVNSLVAMRMMMGKFKDDAKLQYGGHSAIDLTKGVYYRGDSQGGILGATYMALSTDVTRGYLGEPGMPYNLLLNRSVDFGEFFVILQSTYTTARDLQLVMGLMQLLWDRTEPDGYAPYITENRLPNTPEHHVLINCGIGDYQVSPLGAHILARAVKARNLTPVNRSLFGLEEAAQVNGGNAMTEFDFHLPAVPAGNTAPSDPVTFPDASDPHDKIRQEAPVFDQTDLFLRTGTAKNFCSGKCDPD